MYILDVHHMSDLKDADHYIILVDGNSVRACKTRCLGNFPNAIIVGHIEVNDEFKAYTFFATENVELLMFTELVKDVEYYNQYNYCERKKECDRKYILSNAIIRAKDIKFKIRI